MASNRVVFVLEEALLRNVISLREPPEARDAIH